MKVVRKRKRASSKMKSLGYLTSSQELSLHTHFTLEDSEMEDVRREMRRRESVYVGREWKRRKSIENGDHDENIDENGGSGAMLQVLESIEQYEYLPVSSLLTFSDLHLYIPPLVLKVYVDL